MKPTVACLVAFAVSAAQGPPVFSDSGDPTDAHQPGAAEIRRLESSVRQAILKGDVELFDRLLAEDFSHTSASGRTRTKAEWMEGRTPGQSAYSAYDVHDLKIRIYGDTAVVTGLSDAKWRDEGEERRGRYRFIRVWIRRDGQWKAVAFQSTTAGSD